MASKFFRSSKPGLIFRLLLFLLGSGYFLLFFMVLLLNNYIFWWRVFLLVRICFFMLLKAFRGYAAIISYFFVQEVLGLLFLLLFFGGFQFLILLLKVGVSPFHFWVISFCSFLGGRNLFWFLSFQKLPFIPILLFFLSSFVMFLFLGILFCYFQIFCLSVFKYVVVISSVERFNWVLLVLGFSGLSFVFLFVFYFFSLSLILKETLSFTRGQNRLEMVLIFLNLPLRASFFVKLLSLGFMSERGRAFGWLLLLCMFLGVLSIRALFFSLFLLSSSSSKVDFSIADFSLFSFTFLFLLLFCCSKSLLCWFDRPRFLARGLKIDCLYSSTVWREGPL